MWVESRVFEICAVFFFLAGIVYAVLTGEPVGIAGLFLTGGLGLIIGTYFRFVARRLEQRPEDNPEAEIADGAGDVGFFAPGSYWPFGLAAAAAFVGVSLAFWYIPMLVVATVVLLLMVAGLVFEYHIRPSEH
jgi:Cytochrome c oxidase subunit IV